MSLLVRDAWVLTQDAQRSHVRTNVYCEDGRIVSVGPDSPESDAVIEADGRVLMPGLVNSHTHIPMGLLRGLGDDLPLQQWLEQRIWPAEKKLDAAAMRIGARLGLMEMIAGGTTTALDMYFEEDAIAEETAAAGLRAILGWGLVDSGQTPEGQANGRLGEVESFLQKWSGHDLVRGAPAPHAVYTCHDETLARCAELAERYKTLLHTHAHETRDEVYDVEASRGKRPLAILDDAGALGPRTVLAHCGWTTKAEVGLVAAKGASVAHCPVSNMKLATGATMPLPEFLAAGVPVGLGTDGAASNNRMDLFDTMKFTSLVHKHARWDARVADAQTVLDLATRGGAAALGLGDVVGSIEPGRAADLVLVQRTRAHLVPWHDPVSQIVYAAGAGDVAATVVNGRILYQEGAFHSLDGPQVLADAVALGQQLAMAGDS